MTRSSCVLIGLFALSCAGSSRDSGRDRVGTAPPTEQPQLVVAVVIDQLPAWVVEESLAYLPEDGALRRGMRNGVYTVRSRYPYAGTYTAAGHTTTFTGTTPSGSGVGANEVWSEQSGAAIPSLDDHEHPVHGASGFASPARIADATVADALSAATDGRARIVSLSLKDRGAIPGGGKVPDIAIWYDEKRGRFTTSSYYARRVPAWLDAWHVRHPIDDILTPWRPEDPALLARVAGADDAAGEGDWLGMGRAFPHDPAATPAPYDAVRATPQSATYLLSLAREAVAQYHLGEDDVPDLLALSISTTDYVGHVYGPQSWEYIDALVRIDRELGAFLRELERDRRVAVLITSDHGAAPLPEASRARGIDAHRLIPDEVVARLNAAVTQELGPGDWIATYEPPLVYLTPAAEVAEHRDQAIASIRGALADMPGVHAAYDVRRALTWSPAAEGKRGAVRRSIPLTTDGDVFVLLSEYSIASADMPVGAGTSHGSPWPHDTDVPVVFWGPGVEGGGVIEDIVDHRAVAPTLASLCGIAPPPSMTAAALEGSPRRGSRARRVAAR